jgi:hypothetical protein
MPKAVDTAFNQARRLVAEVGDDVTAVDERQPRLITTFPTYNLVGFRDRYYGIPHSAGPLDLSTSSTDHIDGLIEEDCFEAARTRIESVERQSR